MDPLRGPYDHHGTPYDDLQGFEDLTAQLESAMHADSDEDVMGLGDVPHTSAPDPFSVDRGYAALSDDGLVARSGTGSGTGAPTALLHAALSPPHSYGSAAASAPIGIAVPSSSSEPYHPFGPATDPPSFEDAPACSAPKGVLSPLGLAGLLSSRADGGQTVGSSSSGAGPSSGGGGAGGAGGGGPSGSGGGGGGAGPSGMGRASPDASRGASGLGRTPLRPSLKEQLLSVTVSDPVKRDQPGIFGMKGSFVSYLVCTTTQLPGYAPGHSGVRRRFRDFVALADLLKVRYRGYFLPPRPEKNAVEGQRQTDDFLKDRMVALQEYVNKLARHPAVVRSEELHAFLQAEGELVDSQAWASLQPLYVGGGLVDSTARFSKQLLGLERSVIDPMQAVQATNKTGDLMRALKETAQSLHVAAHDEDEVALRRTRESLEDMLQALVVASLKAERLTNRMDRRGTVLSELGVALFKLSCAEEKHGTPLAAHTGTVRQSQALTRDYKNACDAFQRVSRVALKATSCASVELAPLHEYLSFTPCAIKGLSGREKQLLTHDTLQADIEARKKSIAELEAAGAKVIGGDASKAKRVAEQKADLVKLELSLNAAKSEYEKIKTINMQELATFRHAVNLDMLHMVRTVGGVLRGEALAERDHWLQLASELGVPPDEVAAAGQASFGPTRAAPDML